MNNFIQLENSLVGQFCITAEKIADKIHNINQNLGKSYKEILAEAQEKVSTVDYKDFVTEKILQTPRHFSRYKDDATVVISDKALAAMQNNPDYEAWVFQRVEDEMNFPDYLCFYPGNNGRTATYQFGETKEDYRGTSYSKHSRQPVSNEKSYWDLRLERLKKRLEAEQEYFLQRQQLEEVGEQLAERRAAYNAAVGFDELKPQKPITGVPASLLLAMLNGV